MKPPLDLLTVSEPDEIMVISSEDDSIKPKKTVLSEQMEFPPPPSDSEAGMSEELGELGEEFAEEFPAPPQPHDFPTPPPPTTDLNQAQQNNTNSQESHLFAGTPRTLR